jgi:hypothetical protein
MEPCQKIKKNLHIQEKFKVLLKSKITSFLDGFYDFDRDFCKNWFFLTNFSSHIWKKKIKYTLQNSWNSLKKFGWEFEKFSKKMFVFKWTTSYTLSVGI